MRACLRYLSREAESAMLFCVVALNSRRRTNDWRDRHCKTGIFLVAVSEFDRKRI